MFLRKTFIAKKWSFVNPFLWPFGGMCSATNCEISRSLLSLSVRNVRFCWESRPSSAASSTVSAGAVTGGSVIALDVPGFDWLTSIDDK